LSSRDSRLSRETESPCGEREGVQEGERGMGGRTMEVGRERERQGVGEGRSGQSEKQTR